MSTLTTRVGGWPLTIIRDEESAALAHIGGVLDSVPRELRTIRAQPQGQTSTILSAYVSDVVNWQDAEIAEANLHYAEHVGELVATSIYLSGMDVEHDRNAMIRRHLNGCPRCGYWHRVMLQRLGYSARGSGRPPTITVPAADDDLKVAVFYKGSRVREMGVPYWSDPDPEGRRIMLVHVEAYAPWGEVLCATAPVSEVRLHPFHEVRQE